MGTQQLLLIILGVIVIGIGVAVGINIFGSNAEQANKDAITQDCMHLAAAAQGFYRKPGMLGGGDNSFNNIEITDCGMREAGDVVTGENLNGTYTIKADGDELTIIGTSNIGGDKTVVLVCDMRILGEDRLSVKYGGW